MSCEMHYLDVIPLMCGKEGAVVKIVSEKNALRWFPLWIFTLLMFINEDRNAENCVPVFIFSYPLACIFSAWSLFSAFDKAVEFTV